MATRRRRLKRRRKNQEKIKKSFRVNGSPPGPTHGYAPEATPTFDPDSQPYHEHLTTSFQAFRARKWRPLTPDEVPPKPSVARCRPISGRPVSAAVPPSSQSLPQRPCSVPLSSTRTPHYQSYLLPRPDTPRVNPGPFDTLSPHILSYLVTDPRPTTPNSTYGDILRITSRRVKSRKTKKPIRKPALGEDDFVEDSICSVSGIDSDGASGSDDDEDENETDDSDNDSISELEKGNEPPVDYNRQVPDLHLRPERLDHVYTPENKRDMRRFDFDAERVDIPPYEFECPIPAAFNRIIFRLHARENTDWRFSTPVATTTGPVDPTLSAMFDRMVEIEKHQIETEEWEDRRQKQLKKRPLSRAASASNKLRDSKRCCSACLQPACVGDCPNKRVPANCCEKCLQSFCTGTCTETKYEQRMRQPREDLSAMLPPRPNLPRNCRTCQKRHNAKFINANHVVQGRPISAFSTYSRGKGSVKPKDLRPKSAFNIAECISRGIEKLGLEPHQPAPPPTNKPPQPRSRNGIIPGKSYFSNLSKSLTDLSTKKRRRTGKTKRPKTAAA